MVYVCPAKDIDCGDRPDNWCATCPKQPMKHDLYDKVKQVVPTWGVFRIAMIQQTFLIGYNRAFRLVDDLLAEGVIESVPSEDGGYYKAITQKEKLMKDFAPFWMQPSRLFGLDVVEAKTQPRYEMPEWLVPGVVRWDEKFRAETNEWAREVCGVVDVIPRGTAYVLGGRMAVMHPSDVVKISSIC